VRARGGRAEVRAAEWRRPSRLHLSGEPCPARSDQGPAGDGAREELPGAGEGRAGKRSEANTHAKLGGFSENRLNWARIILRSSKELAEAVVAGFKLFDAALAEVEAVKKQNETDESKLVRLREEAWDLADFVRDEQLTLAET
jgi:hypothetical protein